MDLLSSLAPLFLVPLVATHLVNPVIITELSIVPNEELSQIPWISEHNFNPEHDVRFTLYTNEGGDVGQELLWKNTSWIKNSPFNPRNPTRITIHGWFGGRNVPLNKEIRSALFSTGLFNVIVVDWSLGAQTIDYKIASQRIAETGEVAARMLEGLSETTGADTRQMTVIGFSLGAHVAGFVGKNMKRQLGAIVALDPALPMFSASGPKERLHHSDALYVQVIYTNGGRLGFLQPIGDGNFYPNGGQRQPGCGLDFFGACSHNMAWKYYAESIRSSAGFWATRCRGGINEIISGKCESNGELFRMGGEPLQTNAWGVFHLSTNGKSPYARGQ